MKGEVLVLGGGVGGLTGALELKRMGYNVCLLEKEEDVGGKVKDYCCKATESCNKCFACVGDKIVEAFKASDIEYYTSTEIEYISRKNGEIVVEFKGRDKNSKIVRTKKNFSAALLAIGFTPFEAENFKKEYGYGLWDGVITGLDLEKIIREKGDVGDDKNKIAFIQCVGSRDRVLNKVYCSKVCCAYSLRMADVLLFNKPSREIHFFYMDIQPIWKGFESFIEKLKEKGIKLHRFLPSKVYGFKGSSKVYFQMIEDGKVTTKEFDLVVLSIGISPNKDLEGLSKALGFSRNFWGFVTDTPSNIFPVGTVIGPMDIMSTVNSAKEAAQKLATYMEGKND